MEFTPELQRIHEEAVHAVGQLEGISRTMDPDRLLYMYVRKEAVLSSRIEGTQSILSDLLEYENDAVPGTPLDDVQEVSRYVTALYHGLDRIRRNVTGRSRDRLYVYRQQLELLNAGTDTFAHPSLTLTAFSMAIVGEPIRLGGVCDTCVNVLQLINQLQHVYATRK